MASFILRTPARTILVDTGMGVRPTPAPNSVSGLMLIDMEAKGIRRDEVDMVVITHLHIDHVGWNLVHENGEVRPTFANASYWVPRSDWDHFTRLPDDSRPPYVDSQVIPLESLGCLNFMEGEQALTDELTCVPTPGHTPGHTSFLLSSAGEQGIVLGDVAHSPAQVQQTDWCPRVDIDPERSTASRTDIMERAEREGLLLLAGHFPAPSFGHVVRLQGHRRWQPL